jgi:hypothetical protein
VPLTDGAAVARCGTGTCGDIRAGVGAAGDGTGAMGVMGVICVIGGTGVAAGASAATCGATGWLYGRRVGGGGAAT